MRNFKDIDEWVDEGNNNIFPSFLLFFLDGKQRYTRLRVTAKDKIARIMKDYDKDTSVKSIAKTFKISNRKLKKLITENETLKA